jgi:PIN domain nuclease of toxin-antitoxin system
LGRRRLTSYLLDTHVWAWAIKFDRQLPKRIAGLLIDAAAIHVSAITFYEIAQKVRLGKWPEMEEIAKDLSSVLADQGGVLADITGEVSQRAGALDWSHRDPFDRLIAATAIELQVPLISADAAFDPLAGRRDWPGRIWRVA